MAGMCSRCGVNPKRTYKNSRSSSCKACHALDAKNAYHNGSTEQKSKRKERDRAQGLKKYGLTIPEYDQMLADQGGACAICRMLPKKRRLAVDHNHKTKTVRGLLCYRCNYMIVHKYTSRELLESAARYLLAAGE